MNETAPMSRPAHRRTERIGARATGEEKRLVTEARVPSTPRVFEVLCRIDAFADYIAEVEADDAEAAAELARKNHEGYEWAHRSTEEFDARLYVALDADGNEIERTQVGDF